MGRCLSLPKLRRESVSRAEDRGEGRKELLGRLENAKVCFVDWKGGEREREMFSEEGNICK